MPLMGRWDTHWNSLSGGTEIKDHEGRVGGGGRGQGASLETAGCWGWGERKQWSVASWTHVGGQPSRRREEGTQTYIPEPPSSPCPSSYLMALLNCVDVGALGTCSLRYPYFSRNAWGREEHQLFPLGGILSPPLVSKHPWHIHHAWFHPLSQQDL